MAGNERNASETYECDVLVAGSGCSGMSAAITARYRGLDVLIVEKEPRFGGTTARSGGWLWIPGTSLAKAYGITKLVLLPLLLTLAGCKADLYTKVQEREANEMLGLLLSKGVDAIRVVGKDGTSTIQVEEKQLAYSIELLNNQGLPRQPFKSLGEVFKGAGLVASPVEERARYVYALSEELSRTINDIDGVLSARVHVVLPKNDLLRQDATPSSASVFIRAKFIW